MWPNLQETPDLVTCTEETLNGKLHFCVVDLRCEYSLPFDFVKDLLDYC